MISASALPTRPSVRPLALVGGLGVALLGLSTAVAAAGGDWQAMLAACHQMMAAMGIQLSPEQLRPMMAGCMGR